MVISRRIASIFLGVLILVQIGQCDPSTMDRFKADVGFATETIASGDLSSALVSSSSALYVWKDDSNFLELVRLFKREYDRLSRDELAGEYIRRREVLTDTQSWPAWVDTGLIALVLDRPQDAADCFLRAVAVPDAEGTAFLHLLRSCALMELGDYDVAEVAYRSALRDAGDPASKFRIKYEYVQGHYNTSRLSEALKPDGPIEACVASTYPIEALFGHYEKLLHAWSVDDTTAVASEVEYIESLLPVTQPRDDSRFERRRYDEAENLVRRVARAQSGDEAVAMILDEESTWFDFKTGNYKAIIDRLKPWKVKYPVSDYPTWDKETAFATLSVHSAYNRACCSFGLEEEAEQGFRSVIDTIPPNENRQLVASSHCWLGNILESRELYREALDQIEAGLEILPATSTYRDVYLTHHRAVSDLLRHFGGASR